MESKILDNIKSFKQINDLSKSDLKQLANELRNFLIEISNSADIHLSSNLGIVEISLAILKCLDLDKDKVLYDTGHQCYIHKILTGRMNEFSSIKKFKGISGFPNSDESSYDVYGTGHSGTAISAALGIKCIDTESFTVVIIGDASIANGTSFEAMNNLAKTKRLIIILNDNGMSISKSIGSLAKWMNEIKINNLFTTVEKSTKMLISPKKDTNFLFTWIFNLYNSIEQKIFSKNIFQNLGLHYIGPFNGNDIKKTIKAINKAKWYSAQKPVLLHFKTTKGLGMVEAEQDKDGSYHSIIHNNSYTIGQDVSSYLSELVSSDKSIKLINPAMYVNCGLKSFVSKHKDNFYDVGICEEHAFSFASGIKLAGGKPIVNLFSCFVFRALDHIQADWVNLKLNNLCLLDRSDLATKDGVSHHGIYDVGVLKNIPNTNIVSFRNYQQMKFLIDIGLENKTNTFIRYPKAYFNNNSGIKTIGDLEYGCWEKMIHNKNNKVIISYGPYINLIYDEIIKNNYKYDLLNAIFINDYNDKQLLLLEKYDEIIVYERVYGNQLGSDIIAAFPNKKITCMHYANEILHGDLKTLDTNQRMDLSDIFKVK